MAEQPKVSILLQLIDKISEPVNGIKGRLDSFATGLKALGATIAATFSAAAIGAFLKSTVQDALESEKSVTRLDAALRVLGTSYRNVAPEAERVLDAIQRTTRYSDEDAREALTVLVTKTGNYNQSLKDLSLVAEVAAFKQVSMAEAADVVAKAHQGLGRDLKSFGIEVKAGTDATEQLRAKLGQFAEEDGKTFGGRLAILNNQWGEFKERIGLAIIGSDRLSDSTSGLTGMVIRMQEWVDKNSASIGRFVDGVIRVGEGLAGLVGGGFRLVNGGLTLMATMWENVRFAGESAGIKLRSAIGSIIQGIGELGQKANPLLKRFGIELGDGMAKAGARMTGQAKADLDVLVNDHKIKLDELKGANVAAVEHTATSTQGALTVASGGVKSAAGIGKAAIDELVSASKTGMAKLTTSVEQTTPALRDEFSRLRQVMQAVGDGWLYIDGAWYQAKPGVADAKETLADTAARAADLAFAVADIAQQAGEGGAELAEFATGIGNIADGIGRIASGDILGGITTGLSGITGIAQMFTGESASARFVRLALQKNTDKLEEHRRILGDLIAIQSPGARVATIGEVLGGFGGGSLQTGGFGNATLSPQRAQQLIGQFAAAGISTGDLDSLAKDAGITIRNQSGAFLAQGLHDLWQWIQDAKLGNYGSTFGGQRSRLRDRATAYNQTAGEQFAGLAELISDPTLGSSLLAGIVNDADLSTPEGRSALRGRLQGLFDAMDSLPAGAFGGLSGSQFKDTILDFIDFLDQIDQGGGAPSVAPGVSGGASAGAGVPDVSLGGGGGGEVGGGAGLTGLVDIQVAARDFLGSLVTVSQEQLAVQRSMDARLEQLVRMGSLGASSAGSLDEDLGFRLRQQQESRGVVTL